MKSREWATFLKIPPPATTDIVPALDPGWCAARGVNADAAVVLRLLRDEVVPLIRHLERKHGLKSYHFLVHDRQSGVPTTEDDHGAYIHLRLKFKRAINLYKKVGLSSWLKSQLPGTVSYIQRYPFEMTRPVDSSGQTSIGGIDLSIIKGGEISMLERAGRLIELQSEWVLALIEAHAWRDDADMVRQVLQFGHFFANMLRMQLR